MARNRKFDRVLGLLLLVALILALMPPSSAKAQDATGALYCYYAHTSRHPDWIKPGVRVKQGDLIGYSGATGYGSGPHLHFGCSPLPPEELQNKLNGPWPFVDPDWKIHQGWIPPLKNPRDANVDYYEYNAAGNQAHHTGNDYVASVGTPLYAVADGEIVWTKWWPTWSEASGAGNGLAIVLKIDGVGTQWSAGNTHTTKVATGWGFLIFIPLGLLVLRRKNPIVYRSTMVGLQKIAVVGWYVILLADQLTFGFTRPERVRMTKAVWYGIKLAVWMFVCIFALSILPVLNEKGVPIQRVVEVAQLTRVQLPAYVFSSYPELEIGENGFYTSGNGSIAPFFPPTVQRWSSRIERWGQTYNLDPNLIATVMTIESCGWADVKSGSGAMSLFQVMPFHFQTGEDPWDPETNAKRGMLFLQQTLAARGDAGGALAAYNGGIGGTSGPQSSWPKESQRYYYWGTGIFNEASQGLTDSPTFNEWLAAGGASLCDGRVGR